MWCEERREERKRQVQGAEQSEHAEEEYRAHAHFHIEDIPMNAQPHILLL